MHIHPTSSGEGLMRMYLTRQLAFLCGVLVVLLLLTKCEGGNGNNDLNVLNPEPSNINDIDDHANAIVKGVTHTTIVYTTIVNPDGTVVAYPIIAAGEVIVPSESRTISETQYSASVEDLRRRMEERREDRLRLLHTAAPAAGERIVTRPDILIEKEIFPIPPSDLRAAAPTVWDVPTGGKEGQIMMIQNGKIIWRDFPFLEQIRSMAPHGDTPTKRAGGTRGGGGGGSTTVVNNTTNNTTVAAPSGWTEATGIVYLTDTTSNVAIGATETSNKLEVIGSISGASLYITGSMSGAGLADCDASTSKLIYDAVTGRFSCGIDETVGAGLSIATGDMRYVNTSGDTMTGSLVIDLTSGNVGLEVVEGISGSIITASVSLTSSGTLVWEGAASGSSLYIASSIQGAGLVDCDIAGTSKLLWDSTTGRFSCGTDANTDTNTTYTAGEGLTLNGTSFSLSDSISGAVLRFMTVSGSTVYGRNSLATSGSLVWEGAASGASLWVSTFEGAGLTDCDLGTSVLRWDDTSNRFTCGSIAAATSTGNVLAIGDARYVNVSGDTMTGTLAINITGGTRSSIGLNVINTISGAVIRAQKTLASSGTLVWEGAASGSSLYIATSLQGAGLTDCDAASQTLNWDATTGRFSCGTDADIDTNTTYTAGRGLSLNGTSFSLNDTITGALVRFNTVSGSTIYARTALNASGALSVDGTAYFNAAAPLKLTDAGFYNCTALETDADGDIVCGADGGGSSYTAGQGLTLNGTTFSLNSAITGSTIHASASLTSSGTLVWEGAASGSSLYIATSLQGAGLTDCDAAGQTLNWDSATGRFSCGTDADTDTNTTYTAGEGLTLNGTSFSLADSISGTVLRFMTVSGSTVYARNSLASSGTLVWEGAASGSSLWVSTFEGAGLTDCDLSSSVLRWDDTSNRFTCGTLAVSTSTSTGNILTIGDARYVRKSGDTMTGALTIAVTNAVRSTIGLNVMSTISGALIHAEKSLTSSGALVWEGAASGSSLYVASSINGAGLVDCDIAGTSKLLWDSTTGRFSCGADANTDTNTTYTAGEGLTLNGTSFSLNDTITGALVRFNTVSGSTIYAKNTLASSGTLVWEGAASGASLWVSTLEGAGLTDCDASGQTLNWDATSKRFTCGTDESAGSGLDQNTADARYVNTSGDTMTGALVINITGGNRNTLGLNVLNTISGALVHAEKSLTSSGTLVWEGAASGASLYIASSIQGAGLTDCDAAGQTLNWDSTTGRFSCGTDADTDTNTTYTAGEGLTLNGTSFSLNDTITGALVRFTTVSGSTIYARNSLSTSGSLVWEGAASGSSLYVASSINGAGLVDCDIAGTSKLLWDSTTGRFSCGTDANTDTNTTYTAGRGLSLNGTSFSLNDTITGALVSFTTVSGSTIYARNSLSTSGSLVWEGAASGSSLWVSTFDGAGLTDCDLTNNVLRWDDTANRFSCGMMAASTSTGNVLAIGDSRYVRKSGDTMTGALVINITNGVRGTIGLNVINTISGAVIHGEKSVTSSGTLVWEGAASGSTLYVARSLNGAGLVDCDITGSSKLLWDSTTGRFSCGTDANTDTNTTYTAGKGLTLNGTSFSLNDTITGALVRFTTVSGSTIYARNSLASSGTLVWEGAASGSSLYVASSINGAGLVDCDIAGTSKLLWDATTGRFSCGTDADIDTNTTYTAGRGLSLNGTSFSLNDTITGALVRFTTVSGSVITARNSLASSGTLVWEGAASGSSLWVSTFEGAGLTDCDAAGQTLNWDATTRRFVCGTDEAAADGLDTGTADVRYVNISGDTMTGELIINITGGNRNTVGLNVINTISGAVIHGEKSLTSSGTLVWEGAASGSSLYVSSSINGAGLVDCDIAGTSKLLWDSTTGRFSCGTDADTDTNTTYTAGEGLTLNGTSFSLNETITGALVRFTTISGSVITAHNSLSTSGTLVWEGAASGSSLYIASSLQGAGLTDCDLSTSQLKWDATTGRFSCGTITSTAEVGTLSFTGAVLRLGDTRYVRKAGDTMTGALIIDDQTSSGPALTASGTNSPVAVIQNLAGAVSYMQFYSNSTGINGLNDGLTIGYNGAAWIYNREATALNFGTSNALRMNIGATGNVAIGSQAAGSKLSVSGSAIIGASIGTSAADAGVALEIIGTASGRVLRAQDTLASSGTLVWEGAASGSSLYIASSLQGAGLVDCDVALTSKLLWDATTGRFTCGTDQTGGSGSPEVGTTSFTGAVLRTSDSRYVNISGDTMTGVLVINNGNTHTNTATPLLVVRGVMSGTIIRAQMGLASSGTLVWEGAGSGQALNLGGGNMTVSRSGALVWNEPGNNIDFRLESDTNDAMFVLDGSANRIGIGTRAPKAFFDVVGTMSGARIFASTLLSTSGALMIESMAKAGSGAATVIGFEYQTGAYIYSSGATALALETYTQSGSKAPHIVFGYRGNFDTRITRQSTGSLTFNSQTGVLLRLDSERTDETGNILEVFSDFSTDENKVFRVQANGTVFADGSYNSTGADYAEWFYSSDDLQPGEVVCIDVTRNNAVKRCSRDADGNVMGIVSTNPAFIGNRISGADGLMPPGYVLVGLIGQVPAKVTNEGGVIRPGDSLTAATEAGYARKARAGESTVGVALEGMTSEEGTVNVLISRRNQSLTVEAIDQQMTERIAAMEIEDEVQLMVSAALGDLNVDTKISAEVQRQVNTLTSQQQSLDDIKNELVLLKQEVARIASLTGSVTEVTTGDMLAHLSASTLELEDTLTTGGNARIGGDLNIDGALTASSLFVPQGLTIDGGTVINGDLIASMLTVTSDAHVAGTLTIGGTLAFASGSVIDLSAATVNMSDLIVENTLFIMGDLTIQGMAMFLGDLQVKGELILSENQVGFALIPKSGTSVTVNFASGSKATPVVTASPDVPVLYAVSNSSATGFTIRLAGPAPEDVMFSWHALSIASPVTIRAEVAEDGSMIFPLDDKGVPVSSVMAWNACIRNIPMFDDSGVPLSCSRYHDGYTWTHPDLGVSFIWNTTMNPPYLKVPEGFEPMINESSSSIVNAINGTVPAEETIIVPVETPVIEESEEAEESEESKDSEESEESEEAAAIPIEETPAEAPVIEESEELEDSEESEESEEAATEPAESPATEPAPQSEPAATPSETPAAPVTE
jgi:hypothetical protein